MFVIKILSTVWMVGVLLVLLSSCIRLVSKGADPFSTFMGSAIAWCVVGFLPVLVAKFAWGFIR